MGGDAGDVLKQVAGYGVGALSALTSLKQGGLQNYFINRQRLLEDPAFRATLVGSPFTSGVFFQSGSEAPAAAPGTMPAAAAAVAQPPDMLFGAPVPRVPGTMPPAPGGAVASPSDVAWLQQHTTPDRRFLPNLPPLAAQTQVEVQAAQGIVSGLQSADPVVRAQAKLAGKIPLTEEETRKLTGGAMQLQAGLGPGSTVGLQIPGMPIQIGSPYNLAAVGPGEYATYDQALAAARAHGADWVVVPTGRNTFGIAAPEKPQPTGVSPLPPASAGGVSPLPGAAGTGGVTTPKPPAPPPAPVPIYPAPQGFVFHHSGGTTLEGLRTTLADRGLGSEYLMDRDGTIYSYAGPGSPHMQPNDEYGGIAPGLTNKNALGMEVVAKDNNDVTPAQIASARKFIADNYPNTAVYGHGEVNPGHKQSSEGMAIVSAIRGDRGVAVASTPTSQPSLLSRVTPGGVAYAATPPSPPPSTTTTTLPPPPTTTTTTVPAAPTTTTTLPSPPTVAAPPPQPPPPPPHRIVRQLPDGSFVPVVPPTPAPTAPRTSALTPPRGAPMPPLLAAAGTPLPSWSVTGGPPLFTAAAGGGAPVAPFAPTMVAAAAPPPYALVPGAELSGIASGAPPAPPEQAVTVPKTAVPFTPAPAGEPGPRIVRAPGVAVAAPAAPVVAPPPGAPAGTRTFTETQPIKPEQGGGTVTFAGQVGAEPPKQTVTTRASAENRLFMNELGIDPMHPQTGDTELLDRHNLDVARREAEVKADVDRLYGKIPEQEPLLKAYNYRSYVTNLLTEFTPEQRAQYVGLAAPTMYAALQPWRNDPDYARFVALNAGLRSAVFAEGGRRPPTAPELQILGPILPSGRETSPASYEAALRVATDKLDNLITGYGALANMRVADLTPEQQAKIIGQYLSGPSAVHYGPYPFDQPQAAAPSATTTTLPTPTPFVVDKLYTLPPPTPAPGP